MLLISKEESDKAKSAYFKEGFIYGAFTGAIIVAMGLYWFSVWMNYVIK